MGITRRALLAKVTRGALVLPWVGCAEAAGGTAEFRSVKIGLHQAGWGSRPPREMFVAARELGFDGVELAPPWLEKRLDLKEAIRLLVEAGTALAPARFVGGQEMRNPAARETYLAKARKYARWIKAHGGKFVIYSTVSGSEARRSQQERKTVAEAFDRIADAVLREGCTPLYHNHYVKSHQESRRLLQEDLEMLDWSRWRLCVDTGHLVLALADPVVFVRTWAEKISWMHCKDVKTADAGQLQRAGARWQDHFTPLGAGVVDFPKILTTLAGTEYPGWLVVEQDNSANPYQTSKTSLQYLRGVRDRLSKS